MRAEIQGVNAKLLTPEMSTEDKLLAINDYICANYSYDYAEKKDCTVYEAWFSDVVTCTGYARIFEAMAKEAGFKAECITGRWTRNGKLYFHIWDRVFQDGAWLEIDVCWNDSSKDNPYWMLTHDEMAKMHMGA